MTRSMGFEVHFPCCYRKSGYTGAKEDRQIRYAVTVAELELTMPSKEACRNWIAEVVSVQQLCLAMLQKHNYSGHVKAHSDTAIHKVQSDTAIHKVPKGFWCPLRSKEHEPEAYSGEAPVGTSSMQMDTGPWDTPVKVRRSQRGRHTRE